MKERAAGLEKVAATGDTQQLPPGTAPGMAISAEMPPAHPAARGTVQVGAAMGGGVDLASSPPRGRHAWGRECGGLWVRGAEVLTNVAVWLGGEAHKRLGLTVALGHGGWQLRCRGARGGGVARPCSLEHEPQPEKRKQHQLREKECGNHGTTPSNKWRNEGIVSGFQVAGISRRIQVQDQYIWRRSSGVHVHSIPRVARRKMSYITERLPVAGRHDPYGTRRETYGWD